MGHSWQVTQGMKTGCDTGLREGNRVGGVVRALLNGLAIVSTSGSNMSQGRVEPIPGLSGAGTTEGRKHPAGL